MLTIEVKPVELFNDDTNEFYYFSGGVLQLEHSLISVSKWESKWHIPFLDEKKEKTLEQMRDYVRCMTLNQVKDPIIYSMLTKENYETIQKYIEDPMSATTITEPPWMKQRAKTNSEKTTSELIYCWMILANIPVEFEKWHINRLMTLIRVVGIKSDPKKMSAKEAAMQRQMLNEERKARNRTRG